MLDGNRGKPVLLALLLGAALAGGATGAAGQLPAELRDGRRALSLGLLTDGGGMVGFSMMLTRRTAFTLDVMGDAALTASESTSDGELIGETEAFRADFLLAPGFRRYMAGRGDVASYLAGRALLGYETLIRETTTSDGLQSRTEQSSPTGGLALGFGLEWFATDALSLRGEVVLDGRYTHSTSTIGDMEETFGSIRAGLGQSALTVSILF